MPRVPRVVFRLAYIYGEITPPIGGHGGGSAAALRGLRNVTLRYSTSSRLYNVDASRGGSGGGKTELSGRLGNMRASCR